MIKITLRALEQNGSLEILLLLLEKENIKITEILAYLREQRIGQSSMYSALKQLKHATLIDETISVYPKLRLIRLTPKGRRVAQKILEIKKILEEE